jgi:hypothetical protein
MATDAQHIGELESDGIRSCALPAGSLSRAFPPTDPPPPTIPNRIDVADKMERAPEQCHISGSESLPTFLQVRVHVPQSFFFI